MCVFSILKWVIDWCIELTKTSKPSIFPRSSRDVCHQLIGMNQVYMFWLLRARSPYYSIWEKKNNKWKPDQQRLLFDEIKKWVIEIETQSSWRDQKVSVSSKKNDSH